MSKKPAGWFALAFSLIAGFEGLRTVAYNDPVGIPTICFGFTAGVELGDTATVTDCENQLKTDVSDYSLAVANAVEVPLSSYELAAYTSFAYNVGVNAFRRSTLLKKLNAGDRLGACYELDRWVYAGGIKLPGLISRRQDEREICLKGVK